MACSPCCRMPGGNLYAAPHASGGLQDIAIVTGAEFVAKDLGMKVETTTVEQLGVARKLTVANNSTTIIADQVRLGGGATTGRVPACRCNMQHGTQCQHMSHCRLFLSFHAPRRRPTRTRSRPASPRSRRSWPRRTAVRARELLQG